MQEKGDVGVYYGCGCVWEDVRLTSLVQNVLNGSAADDSSLHPMLPCGRFELLAVAEKRPICVLVLPLMLI